MGYFKLKAGQKVRYENGDYIFDFQDKPHKKITSRIFPCLLRKNKYQSIGQTILERYNLTRKEIIDPFYIVRGEIAETLAFEYLKSKGYTDLKTFDKDKYDYDNFPNNRKFGGLIDIAIVSPDEDRAVVEVKSKSLSQFKKIEESKGEKAEILQGLLLTELSPRVNKCKMIYVFFTEVRENIIRDSISRDFADGYDINEKVMATKIINKNNWTHKHVRILEFDYYTNEQLKKDMDKTYSILHEFSKTKRLPETYFRKEQREYLNDYIGIKSEEILDLPF